MLRKVILLWIMIVWLLAILLAPLAGASYPAGYVESGYTYYPSQYGYNNYWWKGYQAYTRTYYQPAGYYQQSHYGYTYVQPAGYYTYNYSHTYTPPAAPKVDYKDPGWRSKLLDIAAARDKYEGELRKGAIDHQQYMEALKALGLEGNFSWQGYGQYVPYGSYPQASYGYGFTRQFNTYGANGQTLYGYSYNKIAEVYGDANLAQLYQSANRLAENQQRLAGQATQDFSSLVGQEGTNRAKVAEILAKGQAVQEYLRALEGSGSKTIERSFQTGPNPVLPTQPQANGQGQQNQVQPVPSYQPNSGKPLIPQMQRIPEVNSNLTPDVEKAILIAHLQRDCASCHSDPKKIKRQQPFLVQDWDKYSAQDKLDIYGRVTTTDDDQRMPRLTTGGPGPRVPVQLAELYKKY